ncbi:hypothetical protein Pla22_28420 [Rubripirellula amarantea]|uniref:Uncharacterized protein n=1 Tax=Rubripirellula amarantea TaxID=2527999 RepID=A0A5C5WWU7_9BACT|nr:hypothetical protein Pla22_28420 [Rubripirellula amarantea]
MKSARRQACSLATMGLHREQSDAALVRLRQAIALLQLQTPIQRCHKNLNIGIGMNRTIARMQLNSILFIPRRNLGRFGGNNGKGLKVLPRQRGRKPETTLRMQVAVLKQNSAQRRTCRCKNQLARLKPVSLMHKAIASIRASFHGPSTANISRGASRSKLPNRRG